MNQEILLALQTKIDDYAALINRANKRNADSSVQLEAVKEAVQEGLEILDQRTEVLAKSVNLMMSEMRLSSRRKSAAADTVGEEWSEDFSHSSSGMNFLRVTFEGAMKIQSVLMKLSEILEGLNPGRIQLPEKKGGYLSLEDMQRGSILAGIYSPTIRSYMQATLDVEGMYEQLANAAEGVEGLMESYYRTLVKRHSSDGVEVHVNAVVTDVAMHVYENVDAEGEIAMGRSADELSAYSRRKAAVMTEAVRDPFINGILTEDSGFINFMGGELESVMTFVNRLAMLVEPEVKEVRAMAGVKIPMKSKAKHQSRFSKSMTSIRDLDPSAVPYKEKAGLLTQDERYRVRYRNETLSTISAMLVAQKSTEEIISYVLLRKEEIRKYFQEQNSFYTCAIGAGNPFLGVAPGALQVIPSQRPLSSFDDIVGSGFGELRSFVKTIKGAAAWHSLFAATSPSKSADKSNILMIGPQGCGKTEAMRSIASEKDSLALFAVGSDFKTCWKDEGLKNPKRLFEHAVRLQKESKRHVHILIDEADSVMCKKEFLSHGDDDLTTEFQNLMDGVVAYPNITVWAATNHPERMPMPIIRRFSKVLIVGELTAEDRAVLLKRFFSYLPMDGMGDAEWRSVASQMDGATGDVVRKVADHVWRTRMQWFVDEMPEAAREVRDWLESDGRFEISELSADRRGELVAKLGEHFKVGAKEVRTAVDEHLKNLAIRTEIDSAKMTYENARSVVSGLSKGLIV